MPAFHSNNAGPETARREIPARRLRLSQALLTAAVIVVCATLASVSLAPVEFGLAGATPIVAAAAVTALLLAAGVTALPHLFSARGQRAARLRPLAGGKVTAVAEPKHALLEASDDGDGKEDHPAHFGTVTTRAMVEGLTADETKRAIFVSPEGDDAAAASVLVAREAADKGARVLLLDLSASGPTSRPMLEGRSLPGITDLLTGRAQFGDIIHADYYSEAHLIPIGTADIGQAMQLIDRMPIIMASLTMAYDLVVVECGAADAEGVAHVAAEASRVVVAAVDPGAKVVGDAREGLIAAGFDPVPVVAASLPEALRRAA